MATGLTRGGGSWYKGPGLGGWRGWAPGCCAELRSHPLSVLGLLTPMYPAGRSQRNPREGQELVGRQAAGLAPLALSLNWLTHSVTLPSFPRAVPGPVGRQRTLERLHPEWEREEAETKELPPPHRVMPSCGPSQVTLRFGCHRSGSGGSSRVPCTVVAAPAMVAQIFIFPHSPSRLSVTLLGHHNPEQEPQLCRWN